MLSFAAGLKIYVALEACDLRKSFNGLSAAVSQTLGEDPRQAALFVFTNRRRNRLKILYYDRTGLWVLAKRLEKGAFSWPQSTQARSKRLSLSPEALQLLLDGVDLKDGCRRAWYERE